MNQAPTTIQKTSSTGQAHPSDDPVTANHTPILEHSWQWSFSAVGPWSQILPARGGIYSCGSQTSTPHGFPIQFPEALT